MSSDELERDEVLSRVRMDRRGFVKKLVVGAAFTSPVVVSYAMRGTAFGGRLASYDTYSPTPGAPHFGHRGYGAYGYGSYDLGQGVPYVPHY